MSSYVEVADRPVAADGVANELVSRRLSPEPILAALEGFHGSFVDLDENRTVDAASLALGRRLLARRLAEEGLRAGDRAVVAIGNGPRFAAVLAATLEIGASPLLVHYKTPPAELKRTAERFGAAFVLSDALDDAELAAVGGRCRHILGTEWLYLALTTVDQADPAFSADYPALSGVPLHPTSGSTGLPKVAARPGACAIAEAVNYIGASTVERRDVLLVVTPMSHAYAYGMGLMVPLVSGATVLSMRRFTLKAIQEALSSRGVTVFPAVPAILDLLLFGAGAQLLSRPRLVLSAGAPLGRRTAENFQRATGRLIAPLYGTTETGGITIGVDGAPADNGGYVGPALHGVQARIGHAEEQSLDGGVGRVEIRSTSMMAGYLSPQGIDASPLNDGWFRTGDLGRIDSNGGIQLVGRESDVINVAGLKVVPSEVEEVLAMFPGVVECKVYAGEKRPGTQFVKAAVAGEVSLDITRLKAHCQSHLVYYKRPDVFVRVDALPRSPAGKIAREQLP